MPDNSPEEWYRNLPKITRAYLTIAFAATVVTHAELLDGKLIHLDFDKVFGQLELWRLVTCFSFFGKFSLPFVLSLFFLVRYGKELEIKRFENRSADMLWFMVITGLIMVAVAYLLGDLPILSPSMLSAIVYLWSREYSETVISIYGMFNVQAFYFPWVRAARGACIRECCLCAHVLRLACLRQLGLYQFAGARRHPCSNGRLGCSRLDWDICGALLLLFGGHTGIPAECALLPVQRSRHTSTRGAPGESKPQRFRRLPMGRRTAAWQWVSESSLRRVPWVQPERVTALPSVHSRR